MVSMGIIFSFTNREIYKNDSCMKFINSFLDESTISPGIEYTSFPQTPLDNQE